MTSRGPGSDKPARRGAAESAAAPGSAIDFRHIAEESLSLVIVTDSAGAILYANPTFCESTGFAPGEVMGRRVQDLGELDAETLARLGYALGNGCPWRGQFAALAKGGRKLWFQSSISPITDGDGRVTRFIALGLDITERKRAESALRESEEKFRTLIETMPAAAVIFQGNRVRYANRKVVDVMGYSLDELANLNYWDTVHPDYRDLVRERGAARLRGEDVPSTYEVRFLTKSGEARWGFYSAAVITYEGSPAVIGTIYDITERKAVEEGLLENEERFRHLAESVPAGTFIIQGTKFRFVNTAMRKIFGFTAEEFAAKDFWDTVHPEFQQLVKERGFARQQGVSLPSQYEIKVLTKDGRERWALVTASRTEYEGAPAVIGSIVDITDAKAAEEALRESEEKFRAIVETSRETIWASDVDHRILYVNPAVQSVLGYPPDDLIGTDGREILHPDDWASMEQLFDQFVSAGVGWTGIVTRWRHKDGAWRFFETSASPVFSPDGRVTGFRGTGRDVTERVQAEADLLKSEERYRILYQDNPSMYFTLSEELSVLSVNQHGAEQLGHAPEDLIGQSVLMVVHPDDQTQVKRQLAALVRDRSAKHGIEFRKVRKDGKVIWVKESVRVTHDVDGKRIILVVCEDISERKQVEDALQAFREELEGKAERAVAGKNPYRLSFRELTVLHLVTGGRSDKEISVVLGIRPQTVSKHVANVLKKMNASSRTEAGVRALREGLTT